MNNTNNKSNISLTLSLSHIDWFLNLSVLDVELEPEQSHLDKSQLGVYVHLG